MPEYDFNVTRYQDGLMGFSPYFGFVGASGLCLYQYFRTKRFRWSYITTTVISGTAIYICSLSITKRQFEHRLQYLDYMKRHPEDFVPMKTRTINETWDQWIIRR